MFHTTADDNPVGSSDLQVQHWDALQYMDGFGACDRFTAAFSDAQADFFFGTGSGQIGLTLLRATMYPDGSLSEATNHQKAAARGARVWFAPWTAPGAWKSNGDDNNGGHLSPGHYSDWANRLAAGVTILAGEGVTCYAVSVQGEPNWSASYNSMIYTAAELRDFLKVLGPAVAAVNPATLIMLPETIGATGSGNSDGTNTQAYMDAVLADGTAAPYFGIAAIHQYDGVAALNTNGRPLWHTEMSSFETFDATMTHGLVVAGWIHEALTTAKCSTWHYWRILGLVNDNQGLIGHDGGGELTKRAYVLGNWARFVRPGWYRVRLTGSITNASVTAFKEIGTGKIAVVCINATAGAVSGTIGIYGLTITSLIPYRTSSTEDMAALAAVSVTRGVFTAALPASSVTTFYGTGTGG